MCAESKDAEYTCISRGAGDTFDLGLRLGRRAAAGEVYALYGDLGSGKTAFAQGFAKGLGIDEAVTSPTFVICCAYEGGRLPLYHFDAYRIADVSEMEEIGYEEFFYGDGVSLVEWADLVEELLPRDCIRVWIERVSNDDFDVRRIRISGVRAECLQ
ncbi:MAG: tRNA (adenosine(37)-N6)-threonylcarbamoyltransferase complex ATPase subunit type 1 TsaE [Lachnospiraceae bacterium]|nr:tRNA (adenosine(37)-N6)-threonylcarbamoyltransferase complex ATPase subunit type 1 TsaE [Lachnospiraceae bacterium]